MGIGIGLGLGMALNPTQGVGVSSPVTILGASLLAWWTADRPDLMTLSGSQVASWQDVVSGHNLAQAVGGARPIYSMTSFNGAPGVFFDGVDDLLSMASVPASFPIGSAPSEVTSIFQDDAPNLNVPTRRIFDYGGTTNNDVRSVRNSTTASNRYASGAVGIGASSIGGSAGLYLTGTRHVLSSRIAATEIQTYFDSAPLTPIAAVPATASSITVMGRGSNGSGFMWGQIRDVLVYGPITADQRAALNAWTLPRRML